MVKRSKMMIVYDVLKSISNYNGNLNASKLSLKANLNNKMLKDYKNAMETQGLIIETAGLYSITDKGYEYINKYNSLTEMIK